jgi:hypothetical protein
MDMKMMTGGDWSIALNQGRSNGMADARLLRRIGRELQTVYGEVVEAPVPDHLAEILRRMDQHDSEESK